MRHETVTSGTEPKVDWQGLGYLVSIASVFLLGAVAWPSSTEPEWHSWALSAGMATSIVGMLMRYKAHRDQRREIKQTKAEARRS
jgi:protein-S-isoprenylcysteine O-methyltransferase Ste14